MVALGAFAAQPLVASARAQPARPPVLGDWEGVGPEGLPLSFSLTRAHGLVAIRELTVGDPLRCPGRFAPTDAFNYPHASYIGPGAPPLVRINWRPTEIRIRIGMGAPLSPEWDGQLLSPRQAILSEPAPTKEPAGCGWQSKRLTWRLSPAKRTPVRAGGWSGTIEAPGVSGTVALRVAASGRIVELFSTTIRCESGSGQFGVGPAAVGEFIAANGVFEDATRPAAFQGRFGPAEAVSGTVTGGFSGCGAGPFPFTAHPG
ncbi:MAG: hypothetical protein QOI03_1499 [Solirubrobacteraceae bacterium]|nr:hypothetical protein [Solirubrobacteraceae bacterium]